MRSNDEFNRLWKHSFQLIILISRCYPHGLSSSPWGWPFWKFFLMDCSEAMQAAEIHVAFPFTPSLPQADLPQADLPFKQTYWLARQLSPLNMSFRMDNDASQQPRSCSFLPVLMLGARGVSSPWLWRSRRLTRSVSRFPGEWQAWSYLWEWWLDSSGHSPAATDRKPLPAAGPAPAQRDSGWELISAAHCGPTCCSRWNHPAPRGKTSGVKHGSSMSHEPHPFS